MNELALFDSEGDRKYVCTGEVLRLLKAASRADPMAQAFCLLLAFTGCRISEALELTPARLDRETGRVVFRSLKRRKRVFRAIPVPPALMADLERLADQRLDAELLWPWSRQTAWRRIKSLMRDAGISGAHAMPKGLRHGFGVACAEENMPMPTAQKLLGHAKLQTTAIYQQACGREESAFARRLWRKWGWQDRQPQREAAAMPTVPRKTGRMC